MASSIAARVKRAMAATMGMASVTAGSTWWRGVSGPVVGGARRWWPKTRIGPIPTTKCGTAWPRRTSPIPTRAPTEERWSAAAAPGGMASTSASPPDARVWGMRSANIVQTGSEAWSERPKSPVPMSTR